MYNGLKNDMYIIGLIKDFSLQFYDKSLNQPILDRKEKSIKFNDFFRFE